MRALDRRRSRPPGADWLRAEPWVDAPVPRRGGRDADDAEPRGADAAHVLARDYAGGKGAIVDAGCFLGGSTVALASGLAANRRARRWGLRVQTYDLFEMHPSFRADYPELVADIEGDSIRPRFEEVVGSLLAHVDVHAGDIRDRRWTGGPVEVLFVDICKSWEINDHVVREFFPALIPGRGVVIQQDLIHEWLPYLTITMGLLADYFELVATVPWCSAVYLLTRAIPASAIPARLDALAPERKFSSSTWVAHRSPASTAR